VMYMLYVLYVRTTRIPRILRTTSCDLLCDLGYYFSSHGSIGSIVAHATSTNSSSSALSSCDTYLIRSVTLASSSSSSSLKISVISKLSIKGAVPPSSFASVCAKWLIMPPQRSLPQAQRRARVVAVILSLGEVMPSCSRCVERGLVYVAIAAPSGRQPSFCSKCTSANMRSSYNVHLVSDVKCMYARLLSLWSLLLPCSICLRVSCSICC